jgi:menaquinone-dependent protoporphyrinogen oxidase
MKTLIAFGTRYGCTEKCSKKLAEMLSDNVETVNLKKNLKIDLEEYDTVIIGGSIVIGKINGEVKKFCNNNLSDLLKKRIGLFICAGDADKTEEYLKNNFSAELVNHASVTSYFGYGVNFEKLNFALRAMMRKNYKTDKSFTKILEDNISKFASEIKSI